MEDARRIERFAGQIEQMRQEIAKEIVGQQGVVDAVLMCVVAGGNALLEGVPGLGKTRLVRAVSHALDLSFGRVQFTPDLMPADVTGTNIVVSRDGKTTFEFQPGPLFHNIVLADEINRATPKTQSALLEAMQERAVTVAGKTYELPSPYFVLATQNPVEQEGTYPLPEAQLDRFLMKILVGFPSMQELSGIVSMTVIKDEVCAQPVISGAELMQMRRVARQVPIAQAVEEAALRLVLMSHPEIEGCPDATKKYVRFGASPRAAQAILSLSRVRALMQGRYNVSFEDVRAVAPACLRHRVGLNFDALADGVTADQLIKGWMAAQKDARGTHA